MRRYILKRIGMMIILLIGMTFLVFTSLYFANGDTAEIVAGANATAEEVERVRVYLGLDQPFFCSIWQICIESSARKSGNLIDN